MSVSQFSPASNTPFPQSTAQSLSSAPVEPSGQQRSPSMFSVIVSATHSAWHSVPVSVFVEQGSVAMSHSVGHASSPEVIAVSQVSSPRRSPSPQLVRQSFRQVSVSTSLPSSHSSSASRRPSPQTAGPESPPASKPTSAGPSSSPHPTNDPKIDKISIVRIMLCPPLRRVCE